MARPLPSIEKIMSDENDDLFEKSMTQKEVEPIGNKNDLYIPDFDLTSLAAYPDHKFRDLEGEAFQDFRS